MARALTGEKLEKELLRLEGMLEYEKKYQAAAFVCGVDEAGRGRCDSSERSENPLS